MTFISNDNYLLSIGFKNGFNSLEYFSETFKKIIGVSPIIYKKYINYNPKVSKDDENKIITNLNRIQNIKDNSIKYLRNRKPSGIHVKKIEFK